LLMLPDPNEDLRLVDLWRAGDQNAARQLFDRYVERLVALARKRISNRLAARVDPDDIVQSVFRTFFGRVKAGQFQLEHEEDLCKLLIRITVHKTLRQAEFHQAAKRDIGVESSADEPSADRLRDVLSREPTPEEAVVFLDQLEHFMNQLRPQERQIVEMRLQGFGTEEIAERLGTYDRKVRRILERICSQAELEGWAP
jgi:RNA polymerase sigma-70 factor, ECF subfamily